MPASPSSSAQAARVALAARLRELMLDAGIDGKELSARCGWHPSKTSRILAGKSAPSESDLRAWCTVCEWNISASPSSNGLLCHATFSFGSISSVRPLAAKILPGIWTCFVKPCLCDPRSTASPPSSRGQSTSGTHTVYVSGVPPM